MKQLTIILFITMLATLENCIHPAPVPAGPSLFKVYYKTKDGADLCNPQTAGHYNKDSVIVFNLTDENGVEATTPSTLNKYNTVPCDNYICTDNKDGYPVQFEIDASTTINLEGVIIQLDTHEMDTLKFKIVKANVGYRVDEIYYKGQVLWNKDTPYPNNLNTMVIVK